MLTRLLQALLPITFAFALQSEATPQVIATINVGINPTGIAITPDGKFGYVGSNNNYEVPGEYTVNVLNLINNTLYQTISDPSFNEPYTVTLNPSATKAYVTNSNSSTVTIIDIATNTVIGVIDGFDGPSGLVINPEGTRAYVNNYGGPTGVGSGNGTTVQIIDLTTDTLLGSPLTVGLAPAAIAMSPNGQLVYTINYVDGNERTGTLSIINTSDNSVRQNVVTGFSGPFGIAINPQGTHAYVTNFGSNNFAPIGTTVSVVDLISLQIVDTIPVGIQPSGIDITSDGRYAYVTNYNTLYAGPGFTNLTPGEGTVNIIDTISGRVVAPVLVVGQAPHGITISPNGRFAYVANYIANTVTVLAIPESPTALPSLIIKKYCS